MGVASFPGSPKACAEKKKKRALYQPCTHAQVLLRFWVNGILSMHPLSPNVITRDVIINIVQNQQFSTQCSTAVSSGG